MLLRRLLSGLAATSVVAAPLALLPAAAYADTTPRSLPTTEDWSDPARIATDDDWSGVLGIVGYRGDGMAGTNTDPRTVLADGSGTPIDVDAQSTATSSAGGVHEVEPAQVVAVQGSGTADAPHLVLRLDTTGRTGISVAYTLRDLDADNGGAQQFALHYRVGATGAYTDVAAGYVADASGTQGDSFPVAAALPADADNQPVVDVRILTTDTTGSDSMTGIDDLSVTSSGGTTAPAEPVAQCPTVLEVPQGEAASALLSASDADSTVTGAEITEGGADGVSLSGFTAETDAEPAQVTLVVADSTAAGAHAVTVTFRTDDEPAQATSCTVAVSVQAPLRVTPISQVQGGGPATPLGGQEVAVEAVVTSLFERDDALDGFFAQEEDEDADGDPSTSEALFVHCRTACPADLAPGDLVRVTGVAGEYFGMTQVDASKGSTQVLARGVGLPAPTPVDLPADGSTGDPATFEAVEGMHAVFPDTLVVSEYFQLERFGQLVLTLDERAYQFTHASSPSDEGYAAFVADLRTRRIILDDDNNDQNDAIEGPDADEPLPYADVRGGDSVTGLTGVLHWSWAGSGGTDAWRVRPVTAEEPVFQRALPRPQEAPGVGGRLTVASFNVLNYFTTVDAGGDVCGPEGGMDCRGADSAAELDRQRAKIVATLAEMDADVVGLIEIQNDDDASTEDLVDALNDAVGAGTYDYVRTGTIGTDAIKQAFVYQPEAVTPVGDEALLTGDVDPRFDSERNRPAVAQTFEEVATGERFTAVVNHLKSKGSGCGEGDDSPADGSGNCDLTRTLAAAALADWLATDPTGSGDPDVLVLGDLNAYKQERPITTLEDAGYTDLLELFQGDDAYTYVFDGQLGYLDHALANAPLLAQVTGAAAWNVNADELPARDYDDDERTTGESSFERRTSVGDLYAPDPFRASDHDPVLVGLALGGNAAPQVDAGGPYDTRVGRDVLLTATASDADGDALALAWDLDGDGAFDDAQGRTASFGRGLPPGTYKVAVLVRDGQETATGTAVVRVATPGRGIDGSPPGRR